MGITLIHARPELAGWGWFIGAGCLALCAMAIRRLHAGVFLLALASLGAGWYSWRVLHVPSSHLSRWASDEPRIISIEGSILEPPRFAYQRAGTFGTFMPAQPRTSLLLRAERAFALEDSGQAIDGRVWVFIEGEDARWTAGDRIRVKGPLRGVRPASNPGEPDRARWARATGIAGSIRVDAREAIAPALMQPSRAHQFDARARKIVSHLRSAARAWLDDPARASSDHDDRTARALLRALLLGTQDAELQPLQDAFTRLGIAHVLSISGLNLAMLVAAMMLALRLLHARPRLEAILASLAIAIYILVIPARAPVLRSAFMAWALLGAEAADRRYDRLTILGWAAAALLVIQPMDLFSTGFQLSFGVVAALLLFTRSVRVKLFGPVPPLGPDTPAQYLVDLLKDSIAASIVAWAIASPLIASKIGIFSPLGALATIVLMPLVGFIMGLGYLTLVVALIVPAAGALASGVLTWASALLASIVFTIDAAPWAVVQVPRISIVWAVLATMALAWWMKPTNQLDRNSVWGHARLALTIGATLWLIWACVAPALGGRAVARVDTLDVGDGTCHLLRVRGESWVFDCGSLRLDIGERVIPAALRAVGVARVRTVVLSHPNVDHYAALPDLIQPLGVRRVIMGEGFINSARSDPFGPAAAMVDRLREAGVEMRIAVAGDSFNLPGGARVTILAPAAGSVWRAANDASLVSRITVPIRGSREVSILMTGDIQREGIASLLERVPAPQADVLEAPHHGSYSDLAAHFVDAVAPRVVIQSTGPSRLNDERWRPQRDARPWFTTASEGMITTTIDDSGEIRVRTFLGAGSRDLPGGP